MSIVSNIELLRRVPVFTALSQEQIAPLAEAISKRRFRRGELLVEQGQQSHTLFILLNGRAAVMTADGRGREVILATMRQGDYIGEMSLIDQQPHSATVKAEVQTDCLVLGRDTFMRCLSDGQTLSLALLKGLVQRLRQADRKIESLALMDVYGRVAHALLECSEEGPDGRHVIREKVSRQDIAKMVGASREMVSRVMKDLEEQGFVQVMDNGGMVLQDRINTLD
jgi:CRP-like cAMP-binding protein